MKKKIFRGVISGIMSFTVALCGNGFTVLADEAVTDDPEALESEIIIELPEESVDGPILLDDEYIEEDVNEDVGQVEEEAGILEFQNDAFDFTSDGARQALLDEAAAFPAKFDLRDVDGRCFVTPVKLQSPFQTCWGFAAIAAAETSILGSLLYDDPDAYTWLDLSEKQLAYFSHTHINDPNNSQNGEGTYSNGTDSSSVYTRGVPFLATSAFSSGIGPHYENTDEFVYRGRNGYTFQNYFDGKYQNYSYSEDDDWSIDESLRFKQDFVLSESFILPTPAGRNSMDGEYSYNAAGTAAIKDQLYHYRAVEMGFHADQSRPNQEGEGQYISKNWAHYTYDDVAPNHAVTIVGWDDDYPATNFVQGYEPRDAEGNLLNGAWLAKNSWGSGEEEFPNKGNGLWGLPVEKKDADGNIVYDENGNAVMVGSGYFWLSYYDHSLTYPEALAFDEAVEDSYFLDEYDLMPVGNISTVDAPVPLKMANVFSAEAGELLKAISCQTAAPGTTATYEVYLLCDEFQSPEDGILMERGSVTYQYGGFHKINLANPIIVQKGQFYSVIITQNLEDGSYNLNLPMSLGPGAGYSSWQVGVINEKESFLYMNGKWYDYSNPEVRRMFYPNKEEIDKDKVAFDNFPIKGYCNVLPVNMNMRMAGDLSGLVIYSGGQVGTSVALRFSGDADREMGNPDIKWGLAEGGENIVTLTPDTSGTTAGIVPISIGKTYLSITVDGVGTKVIPVVVTPAVPAEISLIKGDTYVYTGKAIKPEVIVRTASYRELKEGVDYTLSYENNKKCGTAFAVATAIGDFPEGKRPEPVRQPFYIKPAKAKVAKLTAGKNKLTVTVKDQYASGIEGYQIRYREKGTSTWKAKTLKSGKTSVAIKNLKTGKQYEVRVRAFVTIDQTVYYGKYSDTKTSAAVK